MSSTAQLALLACALGNAAGEPVQPGQRLARGKPVEQVGGQRGAQLTHRGGGRGAVADDVADGERDPVVVEQEDVVPVAARLDLGGGQVAGRQRQPVVLGQRAGEQALLQDGGDAALAVGVDRPVAGSARPSPTSVVAKPRSSAGNSRAVGKARATAPRVWPATRSGNAAAATTGTASSARCG